MHRGGKVPVCPRTITGACGRDESEDEDVDEDDELLS
jgi:hypothetical protein